MKVIIADDSPILRSRIKDLLNSINHVEIVGEAENGLETLELVENLQPDLLIMDIRMPEMNGISVLKKIKEQGCSCKICILTNYPYKQYKEKCMEEGADYFIDKNQDLPAMMSIVEKLANR